MNLCHFYFRLKGLTAKLSVNTAVTVSGGWVDKDLSVPSASFSYIRSVTSLAKLSVGLKG